MSPNSLKAWRHNALKGQIARATKAAEAVLSADTITESARYYAQKAFVALKGLEVNLKDRKDS